MRYKLENAKDLPPGNYEVIATKAEMRCGECLVTLKVLEKQLNLLDCGCKFGRPCGCG
jgi:hypothetical protein